MDHSEAAILAQRLVYRDSMVLGFVSGHDFSLVISFVIPSGERLSAKRMILRSRGTCFSPTPPRTAGAHVSRLLRDMRFHNPVLLEFWRSLTRNATTSEVAKKLRPKRFLGRARFQSCR